MSKQHRYEVGQMVEYKPTGEWGRVFFQGLDNAGRSSIYTVELIDKRGENSNTYIKAMNYELRPIAENTEYYE